jgi:hypothetical protein
VTHATSHCPDAGPVAYGIPLVGIDGWAVAAPETVGLASAPLRVLGERFKASTEANVHSILVVRRGMLVYEQYLAGMMRIGTKNFPFARGIIPPQPPTNPGASFPPDARSTL